MTTTEQPSGMEPTPDQTTTTPLVPTTLTEITWDADSADLPTFVSEHVVARRPAWLSAADLPPATPNRHERRAADARRRRRSRRR